MTDNRTQDESSTGHHADAPGSTPLSDAAVEQVAGGGIGGNGGVGSTYGGCTRSDVCTAVSHEVTCPKSPNYTT